MALYNDYIRQQVAEKIKQRPSYLKQVALQKYYLNKKKENSFMEKCVLQNPEIVSICEKKIDSEKNFKQEEVGFEQKEELI